MTGYEVDDVIVEGKIILKDKKFQTIDSQRIIDQANQRAQDIFEETTDDCMRAGSKMVTYVRERKLLNQNLMD